MRLRPTPRSCRPPAPAWASEIGRELMTAYLATLKADSDVKINQAMLEKKP